MSQFTNTLAGENDTETWKDLDDTVLLRKHDLLETQCTEHPTQPEPETQEDESPEPPTKPNCEFCGLKPQKYKCPSCLELHCS